MNLTEIKIKPISELVDIATELGLEDGGRLKKQELIFKIFKHKASEGVEIFGGGVLEILNDGKEVNIYKLYGESVSYFIFIKMKILLFQKIKKYKDKFNLVEK